MFKILILINILFFSLEAKQKRSMLNINVKEVNKYKNIKKKKIKIGRKSKNRAQAYRKGALKKILFKKINTTIKFYLKTVKTMPKGEKKLDVYENILNLFIEKALYLSDFEHKSYYVKLTKWERSGGGSIGEPNLDESRSQKTWRNIIKLINKILKEYPKAKKADEYLFNKALAYSFLNEKERSFKTLNLIIKKYKNSNILGRVYYLVGEYYFEESDFEKAISTYKKVLIYPRSKEYPWALFKLGWSYYNISSFNQSLSSWKRAVRHLRMKKSRSNTYFKRDILKDMVNVFAELKIVDSAIAYFKANEKINKLDVIIRDLAEAFASNGKFAQAIRVYSKMLSITPNSKLAPQAHKDMISLANQQKRYQMVINELKKLPILYNPKSGWVAANKRNKKFVKSNLNMIKKEIIYYAKLYHSKGINIKKQNFYNLAIKVYDLFLNSYKKSIEIAEMKYLKADILYFNRKYIKAGDIYKDIVAMGKKKAIIINRAQKKKKNIHFKSARYMVDSFLNAFKPKLDILVKIKPNFKSSPKIITKNAKTFIESCKIYSKWYKKDTKYIKNCDLVISEIYYKNNHKKLAIAQFWLLIEKYLGSKEAFGAINNLIPIYKDDNKELITTIMRILKYDIYRKSKLGSKLKILLNTAQIEQISKEKDLFKKASMYQKHVEKNPHIKEGDKLMFNAALFYYKSGNSKLAVRSYKNLVNTYPKSNLVKKSLIQITQLYENMLDYNSAYNHYLLLYKKFPKSKESGAALAKACELSSAIRPVDAVGICLKFAKLDFQTAKVHFNRIIDHLYLNDDTDTLNKTVNIYLKNLNPNISERIIALYKVYKLNSEDSEIGRYALNNIIALFKTSKGKIDSLAFKFVGEIGFKNTRNILKTVLSDKFVGGVLNNLAASINRMTAKVVQVEKSYLSVVNIGDAYWAVAAYHQIARAYEHFAYQLQNPPNIDQVKLTDIKNKLLPQAKMVMKKSFDFYNLAINTAKKFKIYNQWVPKANAGIIRLKGKSNMYFDDWVVQPDFVSTNIPSNTAKALR